MEAGKDVSVHQGGVGRAVVHLPKDMGVQQMEGESDPSMLKG